MRPATIFASPRWQRSSPALLAGPRSRSPSCQEWVNLGATVVSSFTMRLSAALLPAGLLLAACATFNANVQTKKDLNQLKHIFVQQSGNDNHGLDTLIVRQLQDRGIQAESGPLTLMPRDATPSVSARSAADKVPLLRSRSSSPRRSRWMAALSTGKESAPVIRRPVRHHGRNRSARAATTSVAAAR